ncbi:AI-2E family transporter [Spongisporangium articulatum]|uniref:AI-2E family transporter n=1 Tax=Spongisporangium articulatum TaxID=3362603 RepID=A0ABW8AUS3_9ACTN
MSTSDPDATEPDRVTQEAAEVADAEEGASSGPETSPDYGRAGRPVNRTSPFYIGFVGAIGAVLGYELLKLVGQISQVLTLVGIAAFLAVGLDPLVRWLQGRGLRRVWAVTIVFVVLIGFVAGFLAIVLPTIIEQATQLTTSLPATIDNLTRTDFIRQLNADYGVVDNASNQIRAKVSDGETLLDLFGGILGAGRAVLSGAFSTFTVLVLTLYFLASLNSIKEAGYSLVPASRRDRVRALGDEILRRIGGYVAGQVAVASINGFLTFILLTVLGVPYPAVLAITTAVLGLIPLVGATLGAIIVVLVGLFQSWQIGVGLIVYYVIYQQVENYLIAPRIMARTVSVPGSVALVAALIGSSLLGVLGALVAIPLAAGILLLIQEVLLPRQEQH